MKGTRIFTIIASGVAAILTATGIAGVMTASANDKYETTLKWVAPETWYGQCSEWIDHGCVYIGSNDDRYARYEWTGWRDAAAWIHEMDEDDFECEWNFALDPIRVKWWVTKEVVRPGAEPETCFAIIVEDAITETSVRTIKPVTEVYS